MIQVGKIPEPDHSAQSRRWCEVKCDTSQGLCKIWQPKWPEKVEWKVVIERHVHRVNKKLDFFVNELVAEHLTLMNALLVPEHLHWWMACWWHCRRAYWRSTTLSLIQRNYTFRQEFLIFAVDVLPICLSIPVHIIDTSWFVPVGPMINDFSFRLCLPK